MKIVAVTACPTGIAHTYMAAEALNIAASEMKYDMKVETRGSVGAENALTDKDIQNADAVIIAADTNVPMERFQGKKLIEVPVKEAISNAQGLIKKALSADTYSTANLSDQVDSIKNQKKSERKGAYKHLMTGVSFMIPFVTAGGIFNCLIICIWY